MADDGETAFAPAPEALPVRERGPRRQRIENGPVAPDEGMVVAEGGAHGRQAVADLLLAVLDPCCRPVADVVQGVGVGAGSAASSSRTRA